VQNYKLCALAIAAALPLASQAAPDMGAHEAGTPAMRFGLR
jgi:hypothetical protein